VLWYASHRALGLPGERSEIYVGTVVAFYEYIQRFFIPIRDLSTKYTIIQRSLAASERIFGLLDVDEFDAPDLSETEEGLTRIGSSEERSDAAEVAFEDVTFAYERGQPVLRGIDIEVREGERVALVGATGSGK